MIPVPETLKLSSLIGSSMQMSYVVPDFEAALAFWTENLGVGPFVVIENAADDRYVFYQENKTTVKMSLAFSYVGEMQIELVHASALEPTPWTDFLAAGREGLHHVGFWPHDFERACAEMETKGFKTESWIQTHEGQISSRYFSGPAHLGVLVELAPNTAARNRYFGGIKALSVGWDGSRPIRRYSTREAYLASTDCS
jgi:catechol 2,3-dioxygenase-like lactoylglutathione lyase family enzyme